MNSIFRKKQLLLLKVQSVRLKLGQNIFDGNITVDDIVWLYQKNNNFGLEEVSTEKEKLLQEIFNCPFLLCDQDFLDPSIKEKLPEILRSRYSAEIQELKYFYNNGDITKEEYQEQRDLIKYSYYYTSEEGQYILRRGHNIKNAVEKK